MLHPNLAILYFSDIQPHRASGWPSYPLLQWHTATPCFTQTQLSPTSVTYSHTMLHPNPAIPYFSDIQPHRTSPSYPLLQWHTATPCFTQTQPSPTSVTYSHTMLHPNPAIPYFSDIQPHRTSPSYPLLQWHTATPCFIQTQPSPTLSCFLWDTISV